MFRDNEISRVSAVLACKAAGDRPGMIAAAIELWVSPAERRDVPDDASTEVWHAIREAGATADAIAAMTNLVDAGQRIREHAFVEIVGALEPASRVVELARRVLDTDWPAEPYLIACFTRLIDLRCEDVLWSFVMTERARLDAPTDRWTAVAYVLTTAGVESSDLVDAWFANWESHAQVPMWVLAAYLAQLACRRDDHLRDLVALARAVYARCTWDATASYFVSYLAFGDLLDGDFPQFQARARSAAISGAPQADDNPILRYAPGGHADALARFLGGLLAHNDRVVGLFAEMIALAPGDPRGPALYREWTRAQPGELPLLRPIWRELARTRLRWRTRFWLDYL